MGPRIQYAQTEDGVNIAYYTLGEGVPFVQMPSIPAGHLRWSPVRVHEVRWREIS